MDEKILICYWFTKITNPRRHQFHRELYGNIEKTHHGKYTAIIKGYLSDKKHERPIRSLLIIFEEDKQNVHKIIRKYKGKYRSFKIVEEV